jgi:hypothetical protein
MAGLNLDRVAVAETGQRIASRVPRDRSGDADEEDLTA